MLLLKFEHLFCSCSRPLSFLSCHTLPFLLALSLHDGEFLGTLPFNSIDTSLSLPLRSKLLFTFSLKDGNLTIVLLLLLFLFLVLEDLLELLDRASMFVGQLLKLGSVLLLFFALTCLFIFGLFVQELIHQFVSLLCRVIELILALFDNFTASLILLMRADCHSCVTSIISLKDI